MYLSRHFRSIARKALRGFWALTIGVTLVAVLLGGGVDFASGSASGGRITDSYRDSGEYYSVYIEESGFSMSRTFLNTPAISRALAVIVPVVTALAVIQLLIGGTIELGLKRYNLDLLTRENPPAFATLFSRFSIWGASIRPAAGDLAADLSVVAAVHCPRHYRKLSLCACTLPDG